MIFTLELAATQRARYWSGRQMTRSTPKLSTTSTAFDEVQVTSTSAFTSAEVLT